MEPLRIQGSSGQAKNKNSVLSRVEQVILDNSHCSRQKAVRTTPKENNSHKPANKVKINLEFVQGERLVQQIHQRSVDEDYKILSGRRHLATNLEGSQPM